MHTSKMIGDGTELAAFEKNHSQKTGRSILDSAAHRGTDAFGYLDGVTLTERVVRFLESYNKTAYGLR